MGCIVDGDRHDAGAGVQLPACVPVRDRRRRGRRSRPDHHPLRRFVVPRGRRARHLRPDRPTSALRPPRARRCARRGGFKPGDLAIVAVQPRRAAGSGHVPAHRDHRRHAIPTIAPSTTRRRLHQLLYRRSPRSLLASTARSRRSRRAARCTTSGPIRASTSGRSRTTARPDPTRRDPRHRAAADRRERGQPEGGVRRRPDGDGTISAAEWVTCPAGGLANRAGGPGRGAGAQPQVRAQRRPGRQPASAP